MRRTVLVGAVILFFVAPHHVEAAELKLLSPGALMSSLKVLVPQFESASGHKVAVTYSPALAIADRRLAFRERP